jgi:hypothetical protein
MSAPCTVVIGASQYLEALCGRLGADGELLSFSDQDARKALETIMARRPAVVVLERLYAATSRGAALINRIKADPSLALAEIRVVAYDGSYSRVSPRRVVVTAPAADSAHETTPFGAPPAAPVLSIDYRGTRRALRYRMIEGTGALVEGAPVALVDLSVIGAQIVSPAVLRPEQRVRVTLSDDDGVVRLNAAVAWVRFEIPKSTPQYRAGVEFSDEQGVAIKAFCRRHQLV